MPKCDGCPREIVKPVHMFVDIRSQRVMMRRHFAFCGERCRTRWWATPDSEPFHPVTTPEMLRGHVREAKKDLRRCAEKLGRHVYSRKGKVFCVRGGEAKDGVEPKNAQHKLAHVDGWEVEPETIDDASHEKAEADGAVVEITDDEFALAPTPALFCCHKEGDPRYDRNLVVVVHRHDGFDANGKPKVSSDQIPFECPCHINEWWKAPG